MKKVPASALDGLHRQKAHRLAESAASSLLSYTRVHRQGEDVVLFDAEDCGVLVAITPEGMRFLRAAMESAKKGPTQ